MTEKTVGGFIGDPAEAFTPPSSSGCCGMAPTTEVEQAAGCCGTAAVAEPQVAEPQVIALPVVDADNTGCCG